MKTNSEEMFERLTTLETLTILHKKLMSLEDVIKEKSQGVIECTCPLDKMDELLSELSTLESRCEEMVRTIRDTLEFGLSCCVDEIEKLYYSDFLSYLYYR